MQIYKKIKEITDNADAIIVGASNGLSITEGLNIFAGDKAFDELFGDFKNKYGIRNILHGFFYDWEYDEEYWAFISRLAMHYSGDYKGSEVMNALISLIKDKPYFIITSNGENHFELAGLDKERIFEIEGSWKELVCSHGCTKDRISSWELLKKMHESEEAGKIPQNLIPRCKNCGAKMIIPTFPEEKKAMDFKKFINQYHGKKLVILELGIGARNQLIKAPLMELVYNEPNARYITFNKGEIYIPEKIKDKSIGVDGNLGEILPQIAKIN